MGVGVNAYQVSRFHSRTDLSMEQVAKSGFRRQTSSPVICAEWNGIISISNLAA